MSDKSTLVSWLQDAYAMEVQAIELLDAQSSRLQDYPEFQAKVSEHREQSRSQAERVRECLDRLGAGTSPLRTGAGQMMANMQAFMTSIMADEVVKDAAADYAFEHLEIAMYDVLVEGARAADEPEIRRVCEEIRKEEKAMADWLKRQLPQIVIQFLERQDGRVPRQAKR